MRNSIAMPEFIQGRKDIPSGPWVVTPFNGQGTSVGGFTDIQKRTMAVPVGDSDYARTVRAHELMHARVSPPDKAVLAPCAAFYDISVDALEAAEEFRVNSLIAALGFPVESQSDGSQTKMGKTWASDKNWDGLVLTAALFAGMKPTGDLLRGVKQVNPEWYERLMALQKEMKAAIGSTKLKKNSWHRQAVSATQSAHIGEVAVPSGFLYTIAVGQIIDSYLNEPPSTPGDGDRKKDDIDKNVNAKVGEGEFAELAWDPNVQLVPFKNNNRMAKRRVASDIGRHPRRVSRFLTDGKVFDKKVRAAGGIVVIDQSGSMSVSSQDIEQMVDAAPGCTIVGYSHSGPGRPNCWIIAKDGKVSTNMDRQGAGNGVDGPIIEWAIKERRKGEPIIWVCDGLVTDGARDQYHDELARDCANLVKKHHIHMVDETHEAVKAIKKAAAGSTLPTRMIGAVADSMR